MKLRILGLMILFVFCFGIVSAFADEPKNQMYYILEMVVNPSTVPDYEKALKNLIAAHKKHNYQAGYATYVTNDFHYLFLIPIQNFAGIDDFAKFEADFIKKVGNENFQKLMNNFVGTYKYYHETVATHNTDLSYSPENPRINSDEVKYIFWNYWYMKPGTEEKMNQIWKEWVALYKKNNIKDGWDAWVCGMGWDTPFYVGAIYGKSDVDYFNTWAENDKIVGPKSTELWDKALSLCRKFEQKTGMPRPDLSYTPKAK